MGAGLSAGHTRRVKSIIYYEDLFVVAPIITYVDIFGGRTRAVPCLFYGWGTLANLFICHSFYRTKGFNFHLTKVIKKNIPTHHQEEATAGCCLFYA